MPSSFIYPSQFQASIAFLKRLEEMPTAATYKDFSATMTAFGILEGAFIPTGETDTYLRDEVRGGLKIKQLAPIRDELQTIIGCEVMKVSTLPEGNFRRGIFRYFLEDISATAPKIGLSPVSQRRFLLVAYSALIAYAPAGTFLPPKPDPLVIDVKRVPGDTPSVRWADADADSGVDVPTITLSVGA